MTKLASDSFLPSGAIDIPTNCPIGGVASHSGFDSSQSRSTTMAPSGDTYNHYGDHPTRQRLVSSPSQNADLQSPRMNPPSADRSHLNFPLAGVHLDTPSPLNLSSSLSPVGAVGGFAAAPASSKTRGGGYFHPNISSLSPPANWDIGGASLSRSVSADAAIAPQTASRLYSGVVGGSSLVENWRLERSNLDALRRRAEKLYRDQQSVIDEMSEEWLKDKTEMSHLIQGLRERIQRLEGENTVLKTIASHTAHIPGLTSPQNSLQSGSGDAHASHSPSLGSNKSPPPRTSGRSASETSASFDLPPGLDGASRRPHYFAKPCGSSCTSPVAAPSHCVHIPLSPRTKPQNSVATDFLPSSSPDHSGDVPIIDIREIDPKLEGIPLKAMAVQRSTFHPTPNQHDKPSSPPRDTWPVASVRGDDQRTQKPEVSLREKIRFDRRRCGLAPLSTSKDQTKQILATDESRRLTMHAGHTPNHSLSLFPTMTATESSSAGARSQETTPTAWASSGFADQHEDTESSDSSASKRQNFDDPPFGQDNQLDGEFDEDIEGYLEPSDDVPLKGPLMIKNIPAQDELFWAQVNRRLDPISRGQDSLPRVLQSPEQEHCQNPAVGPPAPEVGKKVTDTSAIVESDDEEGDAKANVEPEIPLKLRSTSNFGAPFGIV